MSVALRRLIAKTSVAGAPTSRSLGSPSRAFSVSSYFLREPGRKPSNKFRNGGPRANAYKKKWQGPPLVPRSTGPSDVHEIRLRLSAGLEGWCADSSVTKQLRVFGLDEHSVKTLLSHFLGVARTELDTKDEHADPIHRRWRLLGLRDAFSENFDRTIHKAYFIRLIDFAISPQSPLPENQSRHLRRLREATDIEHPSQSYPLARSLKRKIYLHVGPTNSGKTYAALRALAGAKTGVYGGPLRLLAHEVWERLNNGSIMAPPKNTGVDLLDAVRIEDTGELARGRACDLITGEERRLVGVNAGLLSCTMEMMPVTSFFDVAVIDEIQMIGDPERGAAWGRAVLGVWAKEVHLCGEDTVVGLIQKIVAETGDELIINRYKRLSPLSVSESLGGKLDSVQKGDCVVAFSRKRIFATKAAIETSTGLRCAVAYGKLPPEVRSEQAQRFNDPDSGFDVLVASDAVGMGLNLKIKRVVFESVRRFNGQDLEELSLSQTKQIAGRAGRFGTQTDGAKGGLVTTLRDDDLPFLRKAMEAENPPVERAVVEIQSSASEIVRSSLQKGSGYQDVHAALELLTIPGVLYKPPSYTASKEIAKLVDSVVANTNEPIGDIMTFILAPINVKDDTMKAAALVIAKAYFYTLNVKLVEVLNNTGFWTAVEDGRELVTRLRSAEDKELAQRSEKADGRKSKPSQENIHAKLREEVAAAVDALEPVHRLVVLYLWLSYRLSLSFPDQTYAFEVKEEVEQMIDFLLVSLQSTPRTTQSVTIAKETTNASDSSPFRWEYQGSKEASGTGQRMTQVHLPY